ncbi:hypothetical protein ACN2XU_12580 [Primorskyibacter sp. 2E107]|uniref:hypothetical protein n=1 Tax=Primorskyibacter sp. 2E107 TaxID=3403458 RepID=UPI003AF5A28E
MKHLSTVSVLAVCAMSSPALADVTPADVWGNLESYMSGMGYEMEASESMSGDTLTVSDITMSMDIPDADGSVIVGMGEMSLTDNGDGTVAITWPSPMPITVSMDIEGDPVELGFDYSYEGLDMTVSGTPDVMTYDYTADSLGLTLTNLVVDGETITREMATMQLMMAGLSGSSAFNLADSMRMITQTLNASTLTVTGMAAEPGTDNGGNFSLTMTDIESGSESMVPEDMDYTDMAGMLAKGFAGAAQLSHSGFDMSFDANDSGNRTQGTVTTASGTIEFGMSEDAMRYEAGNTDMVVAIQGGDIPLPINATMAETAFTFAVPLQKSEEPQDAAIGITLGGFETSDMIWGMIDPAGVLPRDPATISADLTAKVTPFISLLNEDDMTKLERGEVMPGELNAVTLNSLLVEAAGGKISGEGAFTFDNSDTESFDGFPAPEGKLNLSVSGANGLIDKIIQMGFMSEEDAMGARMMLSMFTVPGSQPDTATSVIEVNDQGHVLANGQRIK